eukprot:259731-Chlamydomonas_euryale.AAC.4
MHWPLPPHARMHSFRPCLRASWIQVLKLYGMAADIPGAERCPDADAHGDKDTPMEEQVTLHNSHAGSHSLPPSHALLLARLNLYGRSCNTGHAHAPLDSRPRRP